MSNYECLRCDRRFKRDSDFDKHQKQLGEWPIPRCMSDNELIARGMVRNRHGEWVTPQRRSKQS